ncbi:MAG TPA: D-alanyl-D-alanine carboxypeptidase/D-alanyl-D-alanine-endopeptidase [Tepidisphaeraceae bacterium]|nr:D-alanyl-D-alanine carboxypeptidase/D-alanyl-D-alanine-endopeptidase [Tepidisphaeraceae bacterium]
MLVLSGCAAANRQARLANKLRTTLHQLDETGVVVGARVLELPGGRELYADQPDRAMLPASNMKLLVTAAALDTWDPQHAFRTYLAMDGQDLWLIGTGDPAVGDPTIARKRGGTSLSVLQTWAKALKDRGIERIRGKLYYYDGALDAEQIHPSWSRGELIHWYAAPISGLNFNDNCIDITIWPTEPGKPVRYEVVPPTRGVTIINRCVTGSDRESGDGEPDWQRQADANVYTITGTCTRKTELKSKPVTDPGAFFADALRTHLESAGISIDGPTVRAPEPLGGALVPPADKIVATHETTLAEILPRINKNSQNLLAEGLCKLLGREYDRQRGIDAPGSWTSGEQSIRAFLQRYGIDDSGLVVADGSGLSRQNRVTARLISEVLLTMWQHPKRQAFFDSLGVGGRDGTIANRFKDLPDRVHAKTGYIGGVRALSGYAQTSQADRWLVFSFIYNQIPGSVRPYEHMQDEACRLLLSYPKLNYRPAATQPAMQPTTYPATLATRRSGA